MDGKRPLVSAKYEYGRIKSLYVTKIMVGVVKVPKCPKILKWDYNVPRNHQKFKMGGLNP